MKAKTSSRLPLSALFYADPQFRQPLDTTAPPFQQFGRSYESCQRAPSSFNGQPTRCVGTVQQNGESRQFRCDFYAATDSRYYAPVALGIWCANWELSCAALGISGDFAVLSSTEQGISAVNALPALPRYDVSWISKGEMA